MCKTSLIGAKAWIVFAKAILCGCYEILDGRYSLGGYLLTPSESILPCLTWIAHTPHQGTSAELPKHIMGYEVPSNCLLNIRCRNIIGNPIVSLLT